MESSRHLSQFLCDDPSRYLYFTRTRTCVGAGVFVLFGSIVLGFGSMRREVDEAHRGRAVVSMNSAREIDQRRARGGWQVVTAMSAYEDGKRARAAEQWESAVHHFGRALDMGAGDGGAPAGRPCSSSATPRGGGG
eukprot:COSAG01_NODE_3698_length_5784_cov_5.069129_8_plen_136_part_00